MTLSEKNSLFLETGNIEEIKHVQRSLTKIHLLCANSTLIRGRFIQNGWHRNEKK